MFPDDGAGPSVQEMDAAHHISSAVKRLSTATLQGDLDRSGALQAIVTVTPRPPTLDVLTRDLLASFARGDKIVSLSGALWL